MALRSIIRSPVRSVVSAIGGSGAGGLLSEARTYLNGVTPDIWLDFVNNRALLNRADVGAPTDVTGWSFTRATAKFGRTAAGLLQSFSSGAPARTDRGLLIEAASANICLQSQTFDNASWAKTRTSITADAIAAPDGTTTADKLVEDSTASNSHFTQQTISSSASASLAFSVYAKKGERQYLRIVVADDALTSGNRMYTTFDLDSGTVNTPGSVGGSGVTASIVAMANGWYRCILSGTIGNTDTDIIVGLALSDSYAVSSSLPSYNGDGASGLYLWGAQLETQADATSYIVTTTGSATRNADVALIGSLSIAYPCTLFVELERASDLGAAVNAVQIDDTTNSERAALQVTSADVLQAILTDGGVTQAAVTVGSALGIGVNAKFAASFNADSVKAARDGVLGTEDVLATLPATATILRVASAVSGAQGQAFIKRIAVVYSAQADASLQAMTT